MSVAWGGAGAGASTPGRVAELGGHDAEEPLAPRADARVLRLPVTGDVERPDLEVADPLGDVRGAGGPPGLDEQAGLARLVAPVERTLPPRLVAGAWDRQSTRVAGQGLSRRRGQRP